MINATKWCLKAVGRTRGGGGGGLPIRCEGLHLAVLALGSVCLGVVVPTMEFAGFR